MNNPLVSIIIPTYNREHLINETLDSVLAQTYINWECIVVDDGSTDNTFDIADEYCKKDSRFQYHKRPINRNKGANASRNYGFELSNGVYVNWFDDDDIMLKDFILFKVDTIKNIDIVITSGIIVDKNKRFIKDFNFSNVYNLYKQFGLGQTKIITNSVMFRRSFLEEKKLFDLKITRGQETEFFLRVFLQVDETKYKVSNFKSFMYRQHSDSKSFRSKKYVKSYKKSQAFIYIENFFISISLKDKDLFIGYYVVLLLLLFDAAEVRDYSNYKYILKNFFTILFKDNSLKFCVILIFSLFLFIAKKRSYTIEKKLKYFNIKMPNNDS